MTVTGDAQPGRAMPVLAVLAVLAVLGTLVACALAAVAVFLAVAYLTSWVPLLLAAAICASLAVGYAGGLVVARLLRRGSTRRGSTRWAGVVAVGCTGVVAAAATSTLLQPLPSVPAARRPPTAPSGTRYWTMPDGARLAYLHLLGPPRTTGPPVIVVGGGPGEEDVADAAQVSFYRRLARHGFDVYLYDQAGAGLSTRLRDPRRYTVARHVADLDTIRQRIGVRRVILLGASWGGSLVAHYMAAHPGHVARAVLTSPGPLDYARRPHPGSVATRLSPHRRDQATGLLPGNPRFSLWYALKTINPTAAHHLVPDREGDAYFTTYLNLIRPGTVCDPAHLPRTYETGGGFYDNMFTTHDAATSHNWSHLRARLAHDQAPTLILTGPCNYISPQVARQYTRVLPDATLVHIPHAGHVIYLDRPTSYLHTIARFLRRDPAQ